MTASYRRPDHVAMVVGPIADEQDSPGVVYLSHLSQGTLVVLEGTSAVIYRSAVEDGDSTSGDLVDHLAEAFGMPPDGIRDDVAGFLAELTSRGLIEAAEGSPPA